MKIGYKKRLFKRYKSISFIEGLLLFILAFGCGAANSGNTTARIANAHEQGSNLLISQNISSNCNRTVNYKSYSSLLPEDFCMPAGYWVVDVFEADINNDETHDRIIKYYKKNWKCGDTIFLTVYFGKTDATYKFIKTFSNLYTPIVRDFIDLEWLVKNCTDKYMSQYAWDNQMWLRFEKGLIIVPFAIDLWNGLDFYFEYDSNRKNWYLSKQQKWYIPDGEYEKKYESNSKIENVKGGICIDNFRIKDYLQPW